jgi:hypothetical protein
MFFRIFSCLFAACLLMNGCVRDVAPVALDDETTRNVKPIPGEVVNDLGSLPDAFVDTILRDAPRPPQDSATKPTDAAFDLREDHLTLDDAVAVEDVLEVMELGDVAGLAEMWEGAKADPMCSTADGLTLYGDLIEPLLSGAQPQSCNQCHLSGMNLSMYAQGSPCDTMSCLLAAGLVDFDNPVESEVLKQIMKADPDSDLITEAVIDKEYQAFLEWITYSATCHTMDCPQPAEFCSGEVQEPPDKDVLSPLGSCTEDEAVSAFTNYVMKWKGRCHGCHTDCDKEFEAPCWLLYDYDADDPVAVHNASMISMYNLIGIGAIDVAHPYQSTMLLKPLKVEHGGLKHGGGDKFADLGDEAYQDYILWLDYYKNCYDNTPPTKPMVSLFKPNKYEKKYQLGELTTLHGFAEDPKEGVLNGAALTWSVDSLEGPIGQGAGPLQVTLPLGKQIVTLTATNTKGLVGTRSFKVYVKE